MICKRCCNNALTGAMPVPGPIKIIGFKTDRVEGDKDCSNGDGDGKGNNGI